MFTGIIETMGQVVSIEKIKENINFGLRSSLTQDLKIDQSLSHNGVCLTIVKKEDELYYVTAIEETLKKSNLKTIELNSWVNLERCTPVNGRLDGHIVQGHVDTMGICVEKKIEAGSWYFEFEYDSQAYFTVEKGSIAVNGVSLTVVNSHKNRFGVAIIPYTYHHTTFKYLSEGKSVNLEFDILGKYIVEWLRRKEEKEKNS